MTHLLTGIDALDVLIFGDPYYVSASSEPSADGTLARPPCAEALRGFVPGEVVLLRGEPGAGKTTLALQIASNVLQTGVSALFIAVEESQERLKAKLRAFGQDPESMIWLDRSSVVELVKPVGTKAGPSHSARAAAQGVTHAAVGVLASQAPEVAAFAQALSPQAEEALHSFFSSVGTILRGMWEKRRRKQLAESLTPGVLKPDLLVIDSLNAFMNLILTSHSGADPRLLLGAICERLRTELGNANNRPVIILTGEYHFHDRDVDHHLPESFFCDTEIVLRTEPLRAARHQVHGDKVTLGYELSALVEDSAKSVESRSFCRVLKCRSAPNQSRRCAYDIAETGLRFFETYPGDGKLLLFAENEQQRERWQSFLQRDMTDAYPALRYELFTMKTLQSVYESTRRLGHVPLRTDMFLASLDSYWVPGYRDYRLKRLINDRLRELMDSVRKVDPYTLLARRPSESLQSTGAQCLKDRQSRAIQYPALVNDLRGDLELPRMTFESLRRTYLEPRRTSGERIPPEEQLFRQYIFDYRHCARAIYAQLLKLKEPPNERQTDAEVTAEILKATRGILKSIEELRGSYLFIGDTFRHDVIQTAQYQKVRRDPRFEAQSEITLRRSNEEVLAALIDISVSGCRIQSGMELSEGTKLVMELPDDAQHADGEVVWSRKNAPRNNWSYGLKFKERLPRATWWKLISPHNGSARAQ